MASEMILGTIWTDKSKYDDAERQHYESLAELPKDTKGCNKEVSPVINPPAPNAPVVNQSKKSKTADMPIIAQQQNEPIEVPKIPTNTIEPRKNEGKEKSSKKNKKAREAQRQRDLLNNSTSNKDVPPSPTKEEEIVLSPLPKIDTHVKSSKTKEAKEKQNKNDKKQANKKDNANANNMTCKVEETLTKNEIDIIKTNEKGGAPQKNSSQCSLASEVAKARQHIKNSLECMDSVLASVPNVEVVNRLNSLEAANAKLQSTVDGLQKIISGLQSDMAKMHMGYSRPPMIAVCPMPPAPPQVAPQKAAPPASSKDDSDDGVDLFASDSEEDDEAAAKIKEDRVAAYAAKKSTKPILIAKSNIILDVKPWDDETDMTVIEKNVRSLATDGLLWGVSKLVPVGYGIRKLRIACVVEDDKVSIDWLTEEIEKFEEVVQSVDIHAFNKV